MKEFIVLSLGGSLIIPGEVDSKYLLNFKNTLNKNKSKYKFIVVCGGGSLARKYINAISKVTKNHKLQSFAGIAATRANARFISYFFGYDQKFGIPHTINEVTKQIKKHDIIFCGGLEYKDRQTSDGTAASIAKHFKCKFVNLTNVSGLYDKNPKKFKDAEFISEISWRDFDIMANKIEFKPGQHFVLDQNASEIIMKNKVPAYIIGPDAKNLDNFLKGKKFKGTEIFG